LRLSKPFANRAKKKQQIKHVLDVKADIEWHNALPLH